MDYVTLLGNVLLTFQAPLTGFLGTLFAVQRNKIIITNNLRADKSFLKIRVDNPGLLRRRCAPAHRPCARLLRSRGEKCQQLQQRVSRPNQSIETRLLQSHVGEKLELLIIVESRQLGFDSGTNGHDRRTLG